MVLSHRLLNQTKFISQEVALLSSVILSSLRRKNPRHNDPAQLSILSSAPELPEPIRGTRWRVALTVVCAFSAALWIALVLTTNP